jgi:hypothetical protein
MPPWYVRPFAAIGRRVSDWAANLGAASIFFLLAFGMIFRSKQFPKIIRQIYYIGATSTVIVLLVGLFTGMALSLQSYHALVKFGAQGSLDTLVSLSLVRELGPVLTAIISFPLLTAFFALIGTPVPNPFSILLTTPSPRSRQKGSLAVGTSALIRAGREPCSNQGEPSRRPRRPWTLSTSSANMLSAK